MRDESTRSAAKELLVRETLEKCVRLSYYERVAKTFSTAASAGNNTQSDGDMTMFMPDQPEPSFRYASNTSDSTNSGSAEEQDPRVIAFADRFLECLRLKQSFAELKAVLQEVAVYGKEHAAQQHSTMMGDKDKDGGDDDDNEGMPLAREILVHCVLLLGSKSFSHTLNMLERHLALLQWATPTDKSKLHLLHIVAAFWCKNKQVGRGVIRSLARSSFIRVSVSVCLVSLPLYLRVYLSFMNNLLLSLSVCLSLSVSLSPSLSISMDSSL